VTKWRSDFKTNLFQACLSIAMKIPKIHIKRIYEPAESTDGFRVLVDRLWPRGVKKEKAHVDEWAKDIAPSTEIRVAYGHIPERWEKFKGQYLAELKKNEDIPHYLDKWEEHPVITMLYAAKDEKHAHVLVLQKYLQDCYKKR